MLSRLASSPPWVSRRWWAPGTLPPLRQSPVPSSAPSSRVATASWVGAVLEMGPGPPAPEPGPLPAPRGGLATRSGVLDRRSQSGRCYREAPSERVTWEGTPAVHSRRGLRRPNAASAPDRPPGGSARPDPATRRRRAGTTQTWPSATRLHCRDPALPLRSRQRAWSRCRWDPLVRELDASERTVQGDRDATDGVRPPTTDVARARARAGGPTARPLCNDIESFTNGAPSHHGGFRRVPYRWIFRGRPSNLRRLRMARRPPGGGRRPATW